jgi:hypothetical protein
VSRKGIVEVGMKQRVRATSPMKHRGTSPMKHRGTSPMKHRATSPMKHRATSPTLVPNVEGEGGGEMGGCHACLDQRVLWGKS